ncbi:MAG: rhamnulokinase [Actinobacteria bacterium]|nr:rhamnulokinase [Actinomycetota bacterium]
MAGKKYIVFDYGASNGRAVVAVYNGSTFKMDVVHRFENQPVIAGGTLYWDTLRLYQELKNGLAFSFGKYKEIVSVAIDAWGADFGMLDINGKLISNPVHYRDMQRVRDAGEMYRIISPEKIFNLTGYSVEPIFDLYHLFSLKLNNDSQYIYGKKFLPIPDLFNYFLTGNTFNELTRFTTTALYNQKEGRLEDSLLKMLGFKKEIFCPIVYPGNVVGILPEDVKKDISISGRINVVATAAHDTASAVAGIPVSKISDDWAFISMGTWCIIGIETDVPLISKAIFKQSFLNEAGAEGTNIFVKNINGLWVIQQCRQRWIKDLDKNISWDEIVAEAKGAGPFRCFIDIEKPEFARTQPDMPMLVMDYCRETSQPVPETIGQVARCIYEGLALKFRYCLALLENFSARKIRVLHLVGGGTQNSLLCQFVADSTGIPVIAGPAETASAGNLIMQLKADGEINSLKEGREISLNSSKVTEYLPGDASLWAEAYQKYLKIVNG